MNGFLLDTNVISDLRRPRPNPGVLAWFEATQSELLHLSVITLGEIRRGIERLRPRDPSQAVHLDRWLETLRIRYSSRIHPIDEQVGLRWGLLGIRQPIAVADGLIAATALHRGLVLVTRNAVDFESHGVPVLNPFE